jgi:hypothetical protein
MPQRIALKALIALEFHGLPFHDSFHGQPRSRTPFVPAVVYRLGSSRGVVASIPIFCFSGPA